jgi:hypothetical protein
MPRAALGIGLGYDITWRGKREEEEEKKGQAMPTVALGIELTPLQDPHGLARLGCVLKPMPTATEAPRTAVGIAWHTPRVSVRRGVFRWAGLAGPYADGPDIWP